MTISVLSTIGKNYRIPLEVMVSSILRTKQAATALVWHIVTDETNGDWDAYVTRLNTTYRQQNAIFVIHRLYELSRAPLPLRGRARPIMYARLLAPQQLAPSLDRVLYLDADMIALRPIEDLWATDLGPHPCACCQDLAVPTVSSGMAISGFREMGLDPGAPYFNAGVMLIDTAKWTSQRVGERALDYLARQAGAVNLFDQEALNVALAGCWQPVSYRWNLIASVAGRPFLDTKRLRFDDCTASLREPGIVHFAGTFKPWLNPFLKGRWFDIYRAALCQSLPAHRFELDLKHWIHAAYDSTLRNWMYPLERAVWEARRGF